MGNYNGIGLHDATMITPAFQHVTITKEDHPLYGLELMILGKPQKKGGKILCQHPDGTQRLIPISWTDYGQSSNGILSSEPNHLLEFNGLCKIVRLLKIWKNEGGKSFMHKKP